MSSIIIRATRPAMLGGRRIEAGETVKAAPLEAAMAVDTGRFQLVHDGDAEVLEQARRDDVKRVLSQVGRPWRGPQVAEPWQRVS